MKYWDYYNGAGLEKPKKPDLSKCPNCGNVINIKKHNYCSSCGFNLHNLKKEWKDYKRKEKLYEKELLNRYNEFWKDIQIKLRFSSTQIKQIEEFLRKHMGDLVKYGRFEELYEVIVDLSNIIKT